MFVGPTDLVGGPHDLLKDLPENSSGYVNQNDLKT
jgi:hypothetical protein